MDYLRISPAVVVAGLFGLVAVFAAPQSHGQAATAKPKTVISKTELTALISEINAQQKQIAENLELIDTKTAALEETLRQARLFVARGGGKGRAR